MLYCVFSIIMEFSERSESPVQSCFSDTINDLSMLHDAAHGLSNTATSFNDQTKTTTQTSNSSVSHIPLSSLSVNSVSSHSSSFIDTSHSCITSTGVLTTSTESSIIFDSQHPKALERQGSDLETQYVIVEDPIDLHSLHEFSTVQIASCSSLGLTDESAAEANILNTPRAIVTDDTDKESNHFSSMELLVADDDISNHAEDSMNSDNCISQQTNGSDALTTFVFSESGINEEHDEGSYSPNYVYQLESIASERTNPQDHDDLIEHSERAGTHSGFDKTETKSDDKTFNFSGKHLDTVAEKPTGADAESVRDAGVVADLFIDSTEVNESDGASTNPTVILVRGKNRVPARDNSTPDLSFLNETDSQEKLAHEKTMFSENLGLIPADTELRIIAQRTKNASKRVRTRRETASKFEWNSGSIIQGHRHIKGAYKCGACNTSFELICALHDHLQDHCIGGSYHYDHLLRTAYPKYDTTCTYSQTVSVGYVTDELEPPKNKRPKIKPSVKPTATKMLGKKRKVQGKVVSQKDVNPLKVGKRKRGRPKRFLDGEDNVKLAEDVIKDTVAEAIDVVVGNVEDDGVGIVEDDEPKDIEFEVSELESVEVESDAGVDKVVEDSKSNVTNSNDNEGQVVPKRAQKRKMTVPRKCLLMSMLEPKKKKAPNTSNKVKSNRKISCEFCSSVFQFTRGLIKHEQEKHADKMTLECDICQHKFMRDYNLERHRLIAHTEDKATFPNERKGIYREKKKKAGRKVQGTVTKATTLCHICHKNVLNEKLNVHLRIHTGEYWVVIQIFILQTNEIKEPYTAVSRRSVRQAIGLLVKCFVPNFSNSFQVI